MENIKKYWWVSFIVLIVIIGMFVQKYGVLPSIGTIIGTGASHIDTTGPAQVTIEPHGVTVKPKPTKDNPKPIPTHTWKPVESKPTITTDETGAVHVKIPRLGFCFYPKAGIEYHDKIHWAIGARVFFWNRFGLAPMFNDKGFTPQVDFRVGNVGVGLGPWFGWLGGKGLSGSLGFFVL